MNLGYLVILALISGCAPHNGERGQSGERGEAGATGAQGPQGPTGAPGQDAEVEVIDPCPNIVVAYPEVLWKLDGILYAVYASGQKIHLAKLTPGTYSTTDGRACTFTVTATNTITH